MLTISDGFRSDKGDMVECVPLPRASPNPRLAPLLLCDWNITPSTTYNGSAPALIVALPRMLTEIAEPGAPDVITALTPAIRPWKLWSIFVIGADLRVFSSNEADAPARSLFFIVP